MHEPPSAPAGNQAAEAQAAQTVARQRGRLRRCRSAPSGRPSARGRTALPAGSRANPLHADSLHLLGVLALQVGRHDLAADLIGQAIGIDATIALYHTNLGNALKASDRLDQSIAMLPQGDRPQATIPGGIQQSGRRAAGAKPARTRPPPASARPSNSGRTCRTPTTISAICSSTWDGRTRRSPATADPSPSGRTTRKHTTTWAPPLGNWAAWTRPPSATARPSRSSRPFAEAHNNLGIVLRRLGRLDEAVACCRNAIALKTDHAGGL